MAAVLLTEMPRNPIVFVGGGRIASAMIAGLRLARNRRTIIVHDRNLSKLKKLKKEFGVIVEPQLERAVAQADLLVIAVRPDSVGDVLSKIRERLGDAEKNVKEKTRPLVAVSLAAGIPLSKLRSYVPRQIRWTRAMPSPACRTGNGLTALVFSPELSRIERANVSSVFSQIGSVLEVSEDRFDAFTVTYSSSHGYHAVAALADAAVRIGLDPKTALIAAAHALADGILAWRESQSSLEELLEEAATPGGIAAATMAAMDASGYRKIVEKGLRAGLTRARANARRG